MKRFIGLLCLLLAPAAWATTTVTGKIQTLGTGNVTSGAFVRFWLRGCAGNQPRVNGTSVIGPTQGGVFFFDIAADASGNTSGTVYSTRDNAGTGNGDIECGGSKTAVWYGMQVFVGGKGGPEMPVHAKSGAALDIASVTPLTTNPVVTSPTGDSTYLRLDAGNSPVTGPLQVPNPCTLDGLLFVTGAGCYTTPAQAQAAMPGTGGIAYIPAGTYTGITPASNQTFICLASPENADVVNGIGITPANTQTQCIFTYTSTLNLTAVQNAHLVGITLDFNNLGFGMVMTSSSFNRFDDVTLHKCGDTTVDCLTITTSGAGPGANSVHNDFNRLRVLCNTAVAHYCKSGIKQQGSGTAFATVNNFYSPLIIGNLLGCIDHEANSDSNFYFNWQCFQMLAVQPGNSYVLGFNLGTPGSNQDADASRFYGGGYTAATNPTSYIRSGVAVGNVIEFAATGVPSVVNLGGANFFANNTLQGINLSVSPFVAPPFSLPGYTQIARLSVANGTQLVAGNFVFSAGFGNTANPSITTLGGTDALFRIAFTSGGAGLGANPTLTLTPPDGTWTNPPSCQVTKADASAPTTYFWAVSIASPTAVTFTFVGTPGATTSYGFTASCGKTPN